MGDNINYERIAEITVKSQAEFDMIPDDFQGRIYIEFGVRYNRAVVNRAFRQPVVAWGNSSVEACGNSSVVACGNVRVVDRHPDTYGRIEVSGNARIVYMPKTIAEFMSFYGIKHDKKRAIFYKAVHHTKNGYEADRNRYFIYEIGGVTQNDCDPDVYKDYSYGIHIAHLAWALSWGRNWHDLAILEVETDIDDVVLPVHSNGKVRTSKVKVLREVPLEECGVYGKILARRVAGRS